MNLPFQWIWTWIRTGHRLQLNNAHLLPVDCKVYLFKFVNTVVRKTTTKFPAPRGHPTLWEICPDFTLHCCWSSLSRWSCWTANSKFDVTCLNNSTSCFSPLAISCWCCGLLLLITMYNSMPNPDAGLSPHDILTITRWTQSKCQNLHERSCPIYVSTSTDTDGNHCFAVNQELHALSMLEWAGNYIIGATLLKFGNWCNWHSIPCCLRWWRSSRWRGSLEWCGLVVANSRSSKPANASAAT